MNTNFITISILKAAAIIGGMVLSIYTINGWSEYDKVANSGLIIFQFAIDELARIKTHLIWQSIGAAVLLAGGFFFPNPKPAA